MLPTRWFFLLLQDENSNINPSYFTSLTNLNKFSFTQLVDLLEFTKMPKKITKRELISNESNLFKF